LYLISGFWGLASYWRCNPLIIDSNCTDIFWDNIFILCFYKSPILSRNGLCLWERVLILDDRLIFWVMLQQAIFSEYKIWGEEINEKKCRTRGQLSHSRPWWALSPSVLSLSHFGFKVELRKKKVSWTNKCNSLETITHIHIQARDAWTSLCLQTRHKCTLSLDLFK
jgi:hypothetical protein